MADRPKSTASNLSQLTERTEKTTTSVVSARGAALTPAHRTWTAYQGPVLYTGPDGLRHQRVSTQSENFLSTGENDNSSEITSQLHYLSRPPPGSSFPKAKNGQIGEIGWVYDTLKMVKGI